MTPSLILEHFGHHFGINFQWCFWLCLNLHQPPKCLYTKHFGGFSTSKILHFLIKFRLNFHIFFDASFWASFFEILVRLGVKKLDFVSPLAPSWDQNGAQNRPNGAKGPPRATVRTPPGRILESTVFQDRFRNAPGHHFFGFLMDFDPLFKDFFWFLIRF